MKVIFRKGDKKFKVKNLKYNIKWLYTNLKLMIGADQDRGVTDPLSGVNPLSGDLSEFPWPRLQSNWGPLLPPHPLHVSGND